MSDGQMQEFEILQRQLQAFDRQVANLEAQLQDASRAKATLASLQEGSEVLVPIGAGIHVPATAADLTRIVIPLGAEYLGEGSVDEANEKLDAHMAKVQEAIAQIRGNMDQLMARAQELQNE